MTNIRKVYSEEVRRQVVAEIESGKMSVMEASCEYGATRSVIKHWLEAYGQFKPKRDVVEVVMKSEKERIAELEKALADSHLKNRVYEEIIKLAEKKYKTDLKKTFGTVQSESSGEKDTKSKRSVRSSGRSGMHTIKGS